MHDRGSAGELYKHGETKRWQVEKDETVGSISNVAATKEKLGFKAKGRKVVREGGSYELRESPAPYKGIFGYENGILRPQNEYFWEDTV